MTSHAGHVAPQLRFGVLQLLAPTQTFGLDSNILPDPREDNVWSSMSPTDEMGHVKGLS